MTREVTNKKELKEAIKDKAEVIVVSDDLSKDLQALVKLMKLPKKKVAAFISFLSATGAVLVGSLAASPLTGGVSGITAVLCTSPAVIVFAAKSKIDIPTLVCVIAICVPLGVSFVLEVLNSYDVETQVELGPLKFTRKAKKNSSSENCETGAEN